MRRSIGGFLVAVMFGVGFCACSKAAQPAAQGPALRLMTVVKGMEKPIEVVHDGTERNFIIEQP
ncbi:MAG: hypothetical protein ABIP55_01220, partial [Tepidisphaeraceae bacterium]